jgi:uncharacterized membrane protein YkvA (DUF1232 family)
VARRIRRAASTRAVAAESGRACSASSAKYRYADIPCGMGRLATIVRNANTARLATQLLALWKLFKHADTPWLAKAVAVAVLAYALSPIDLIPDFIPVLGMLDDVILIPLGVALAVKLTPRHLWRARLAEAEAGADRLPRMIWGTVFVVLAWTLLGWLLAWWLFRQFAAGA